MWTAKQCKLVITGLALLHVACDAEGGPPSERANPLGNVMGTPTPGTAAAGMGASLATPSGGEQARVPAPGPGGTEGPASAGNGGSPGMPDGAGPSTDPTATGVDSDPAGPDPAMMIGDSADTGTGEPSSEPDASDPEPADPDPGTPTSGTDDPTFHVFLLLGQSNMEGYPKAQSADRAEDERVRVLGYDDCGQTGRKVDEWDVAAPPLHSCWNDGLGPGDYFAKTLVEKIPEGDTIGLVPCAINGERIETFMKGRGDKYDWIVKRAKLAQEAGGVIEGIIFHQGESNNTDPAWPGNVNTLVEDLRADLGLGDIPFLAGELLYSGGCAAHNVRVNELPGVVENAHVVSAEGLTVDPSDTQWNLHFGHDAQVTFGKRYGDKMIEVLGW